jgi:hypothetical protein
MFPDLDTITRTTLAICQKGVRFADSGAGKAILWASLLLVGPPPTAATRGTGWPLPAAALLLITCLPALAHSQRLEQISTWLLAGRRPLWFSVAVMAVAVAALFGPALLSGQMIGGPDARNVHYPFETLIANAFRAGRLPFWNPYLFGGTPALAHPQALAFYPPQMLLRSILPIDGAISWSIALHALIGGLGMVGLGRRFGLHPWISLLCGLSLLLGSTVTLQVSAGHVWLLYAFTWMPLAWLLIDIAIQDKSLIALVGAAVAVACLLLTGHITFPAYVLGLISAYELFTSLRMARASIRPARTFLLAAGHLALIYGLGLGLAAIQVVPSLVLAGQSGLAGGYDPLAADSMALKPDQMLAWVSPDLAFAVFSGGKLTQRHDLLWHEWVVYAGLLPLIAMPLAFSRKERRPVALFLIGMAGLALWLALGRAGLLYGWLYDLIPAFRSLRIPPRALVIWMPAILLLTGLGLQSLLDRVVSPVLFWLTTLGGLVVSGFLIALSASLWAAGQRGWPLLAQGGISGMVVSGIFLACAVVLALHLHEGRSPAAILLAALIVVCADLFYQDARDIVWAPPPAAPALDAPIWQEVQAEGSRIMPLPYISHTNWEGQNNAWMPARIPSVFGYDSVVLGDYIRFYNASMKHPETDRRAASFLNVRVFYTGKPVAFAGQGVDSIDAGKIYLYRNSEAIGHAVWVDQVRVIPEEGAALAALQAPEFSYTTTVILPEALRLDPGPPGRASITVTGADPITGGLTVQTRTPREGVLVFSEAYYSERRIRVDGLDQPVLKANTAFMAVRLPAGEHTVEMYYQPTSFLIGLAISGIAGAICMGLVVVEWWKKRSAKRGRAYAVGLQAY